MKKKILLIALLGCFSLQTMAQSGKLKRADNHYKTLSFAYAAEGYEELLGSESDSPEMQGKLAFSYLKMGEFQKSVETYQKMIETSDAKAEDYYNYAYALKRVGDYAGSDRWMQIYAEQASQDSRSALFLSNKNYKSKIESIPPFFEIENLSLNTEASDFGGYYNPSEDKLYFVSARRNNAFIKDEWSWNVKRFLDIFTVDVKEDGNFGRVKMISKVNTRYHEGSMAFSPDGKTVYFTRNNISKGKKRRDTDKIQNLKLYIADVNEKGKFVNSREFPYNSKDYSIGHPTVTADGKTMYLVSDKPGGMGGADIYKVAILEDGGFGDMINLGNKINTEGQEMFPFVDGSGNLYFSSDGLPGLGGLDVYVALSDGNGFGQIHNLGTPINSKDDDFALTMDKNFKKGYLSSNRADGHGDDDIYSITLLRPISFGVIIKGKALDKDGNILPLTKVDLKDEQGNVIASVETAEDGSYAFAVDREKNFSLKGAKSDYFDGNKATNTFTNEEVVYADVVLEKNPGLALKIIILDAKTKAPIEAARLNLQDNLADRSKNVLSDEEGSFLQPLYSKKLNERGSYNVIAQAEGYLTKTVTENALFDKEGVHEIVIELDPEVKDLRELVQINPINFDLNKYNIRPDAASELDKIVEVMNKYPNMVVELGAHTDCRASKKYNETLSDNRAKASAKYIQQRITTPERIYGKGYGESRLLNECACEGNNIVPCTEEQHAVNRRTEFKVISTGDDKVQVKNTSTDSF